MERPGFRNGLSEEDRFMVSESEVLGKNTSKTGDITGNKEKVVL
jgi:hypothetical protein